MHQMELAADALYKAKLICGFCHLAIGQVTVSSLPNATYADPLTSVPRKPYLSVLNMALRGMTVSLLPTAAIHLPSCMVVPLKAFSVNCSAASAVCLMARVAQCTHSFLLRWEQHCGRPSSSRCRRCICSKILWRKALHLCAVRRWCQQSGSGVRILQHFFIITL